MVILDDDIQKVIQNVILECNVQFFVFYLLILWILE